MPLFVDPDSNLFTLLCQFTTTILFDSHLSLSEQWLHPYLTLPPLASVPTEPEWYLLLQSPTQHLMLGGLSALHYDFWGKHQFCLTLVSIPHKILPWQCGLNILWFAWQLHSCIFNVLSSLQCLYYCSHEQQKYYFFHSGDFTLYPFEIILKDI